MRSVTYKNILNHELYYLWQIKTDLELRCGNNNLIWPYQTLQVAKKYDVE
jgi:hypothetical protein